MAWDSFSCVIQILEIYAALLTTLQLKIIYLDYSKFSLRNKYKIADEVYFTKIDYIIVSLSVQLLNGGTLR